MKKKYAKIEPTSKNGLLVLDMQFFAEGSSDGAGDNPAGGDPKSTVDKSAGNQVDNDTLEKLIQQAVDRATNKLGNEKKALQKQLDDLAKQKLSDDERIDLERKQEREQFELEKAQFIQEKNQLFAVNALSKAELGVESDKLDKLIGLVMGKDEAEINENVKNLSDLVKTIVAGKVQKVFEESGRNPAGSKPSTPTEPKDTFGSKLGKELAATNQKSQEVLKHYLGG